MVEQETVNKFANWLSRCTSAVVNFFRHSTQAQLNLSHCHSSISVSALWSLACLLLFHSIIVLLLLSALLSIPLLIVSNTTVILLLLSSPYSLFFTHCTDLHFVISDAFSPDCFYPSLFINTTEKILRYI